MTFQVTDKYFYNGVTTVYINGTKNQSLTGEFDGDFTNLDNDALVMKVFEQFYRQNLLGKFINEAVDIAEQKAKEISETAEQIIRIKEEYEQELLIIKERSDVAQGAMLEMTEMVFDHELRLTALETAEVGEPDEPLNQPSDDHAVEID